MLPKINASTGKTMWEIKMPSTDSKVGKFAGYESIIFTADGGFIAGGFAKGKLNKQPTHIYIRVTQRSATISYDLLLKVATNVHLR